MSVISFSALDGYRGDGSTGSDVCQSYTPADPASRNVWDLGWNAAFKSVNWLLTATANGQLLIGNNTTGRFAKAVPTGSGGITVTAGGGSLDVQIANAGVTPAKMSQAARTQIAKSIVLLDLAGGAQADVPIFASDVACTLLSAYIIYQAAGGTTPAAVSLGRSGSGGSATYYTNAQATTASAAQWSKDILALSATDVPGNSTVYCSTDGAGNAGKALVCVTFEVN